MALVLPTDDLVREVPFTLERAAIDEGDGNTLVGYASVFDSVTRIDSWEGRFDEQFAYGAFTKTLKERTPVVQFDHGHHPMIGSIPLGAPSWSQDRVGLHLDCPLHRNWLMEPVREAIASGAITGMSIRFRVVQESIDESGDIPMRTITECALFEGGPVVFPAYTDTTAAMRSDIRSILADPTAMAELARALVLSTPTDEAASAGTSDEEAAAQQGAAHGHSGMSPAERTALLPPLLVP